MRPHFYFSRSPRCPCPDESHHHAITSDRVVNPGLPTFSHASEVGPFRSRIKVSVIVQVRVCYFA